MILALSHRPLLNGNNISLIYILNKPLQPQRLIFLFVAGFW